MDMFRKQGCFFVFVAFLLVMFTGECLAEKPIEDLVERLLPGQVSVFRFEQIQPDNGKDVFELESIGNKIVIRGNNKISQAVGLNWYLKYYCYSSVSWYAADPIEVPDVLPMVETKVRKSCISVNRFFLNYCTFGYSMPWWDWDDWQRLIDWMALNGINMPLAITGQEAIWQKVWKQFGLSDEQIRAYFTGPTHLPWHRMANLDYWGGPLPQSYINNQFELQKKILKRQRELGMTPVLPAFAGHVPAALKDVLPEAKISLLGEWGGFPDAYRAHFVEPQDPLFAEIQRRFLEEQTKYFGTDHIYCADPFNEIDPPSWEPDYLANVSETIYSSMASVDKDAKWFQMGWLFYCDKENWTQPRMKAALRAVPQGKMILQDYYCDKVEIWKLTEAFFGQSYMWCIVGNFGGSTAIHGSLKDINIKMSNVFTNKAAGDLSGIGAAPEGLNPNYIIFDFLFERPWHSETVDMNNWVRDYARRRCGQKDENLEKAWQILYDQIYVQHPSGSRDNTVLTIRPAIKLRKRPTVHYDNKDLLKVWGLMLDAQNRTRDGYRFDLVNIASQTLGNYALNVEDAMIAAYEAGDKVAFEKASSEFLGIIEDVSRITATRSERLLGKWIKDARSFGINESEQKYYEQNARNIITTWGDKDQLLNDYVRREWAGLTEGFYLKRWEMLVDALRASLENKTAFDDEAFHDEVTEFEWNWTLSNEVYSSKPTGNSYLIAKELYDKYFSKISETN